MKIIDHVPRRPVKLDSTSSLWRLMIPTMSSILMVVLLVFIISWGCGCYEEPDPIYGYYRITADNPVHIQFTNQIGQEDYIHSDDFEYPLEFTEDDQLFWFTIKITVDSPQDVHVVVFFDDGESQMDYDQVVSITDEWSYNGFYCTPWSTQCSRVTVHF